MLRRNRSGIATLVAAIALVLGFSGVVAAPANAATPAGHGVVNGNGLSLAVSVPAPHGAGVHPDATIDCYAHVSSPVLNSYVVTVTGTTVCSQPVVSLQLTVDLYWNYNPWGGGGSGVGTSAVAAAASGVCMPGTWPYYGTMLLKIVWPPSYVGPPTYSETSGYINITC